MPEQQNAGELVVRLGVTGPERERAPVPLGGFLQITLRGAPLLPVHPRMPTGFI